MSKFKVYAKSILIPLILGGVVGVIIMSTSKYNDLIQPPLAPPDYLFPIVWSILYILMGISYGRIALKKQDDFNVKSIYYVQLIVNLLWPIAFFTLEWRLFSFIWLLLLDILVITMVVTFYRKDKLAGLLQIPYLIWSLFASYLNLAIYILNG